MRKQVDYPRVSATKKIYIKVPIISKGKWIPALLMSDGSTQLPVLEIPHNSKRSAQIICKAHNDFHHWTRKQINRIKKQVNYEEPLEK